MEISILPWEVDNGLMQTFKSYTIVFGLIFMLAYHVSLMDSDGVKFGLRKKKLKIATTRGGKYKAFYNGVVPSEKMEILYAEIINL